MNFSKMQSNFKALLTADLFDQPEYSDITIRLSDRDVNCHKVVICNNSEYFRKLCGHGAHFKENDEAVLELKEDDPDAMAVLLLYLYTGTYTADHATAEKFGSQWKGHLEVSRVADKYLVTALEQEASQIAADIIKQLSDSKELVQVIKYHRTNGIKPSSDFDIDNLEAKHQTALLREPEYRQFLESNLDLMWTCVDGLASAVTKNTLVELVHHRCQIYGNTYMKSPTPTDMRCPCCRHAICKRPIWVSPEDVSYFLQQYK